MANIKTQKKEIGFWILTSLVIGNIVGSGIFLLPSTLGQYGSIGLLGWFFTAIGSMCLALVFAKLGSIKPKIGGPYAYCKDAFGDFIGFLVAYIYWMSMCVGNTAIVIVLIGYLSFFFPILAINHGWSFIAGASIIWFIITINILGVKQMGIVQLVTTILKLIPFIAIILVGFFFINTHYLITDFHISNQSPFEALSQTVTLTFWSFLGIECATIPANNIKNPTRNIPRATIIGTTIAALIYILSTLVIMGIMPMHALAESKSPFADAANIIFGHWGGTFIALGAIIAIFGTLNGWIFMQGQIPLAAARDKLFPKIFARTSKKGIPVLNLLFSGTLITLLLTLNFQASLVRQFTSIISLAILAALIPYLYISMAEIIILLKYKKRFPEMKIAKSVIISILTFFYIIWILKGSEEKNIFYGVVFLFSCTPVYVWIKWKQLKVNN